LAFDFWTGLAHALLFPSQTTTNPVVQIMTSETQAKSFDEMTRYIRVRSEPGDKFVEFDFAIGHPELFVELVLPRDAFDIFCKHNNVVHMDSDMIRQIDEDMVKWRFGERGERY
jgi:phenol/toluene 2-monooxygenase (NADH) P0/A0